MQCLHAAPSARPESCGHHMLQHCKCHAAHVACARFTLLQLTIAFNVADSHPMVRTFEAELARLRMRERKCSALDAVISEHSASAQQRTQVQQTTEWRTALDDQEAWIKSHALVVRTEHCANMRALLVEGVQTSGIQALPDAVCTTMRPTSKRGVASLDDEASLCAGRGKYSRRLARMRATARPGHFHASAPRR